MHKPSIHGLPLELIQEIISHLSTRSIKSLSFTCAALRTICFPYIFHTLSSPYRPVGRSTFPMDFGRLAPIPCFRTVYLDFIRDDISAILLPWCRKARTVKMSALNIRNSAIIPYMSLLIDLNLSNVSFWVVDDYFKLLGNLPPTVKRLTAREINFVHYFPPSYTTVGRGVDLEYLKTDTASDLAVLL
ncbi:hypothetical protein EDD18DRAFT_1470227 [Armillaria luteobubalina]|uniref:F-box domain-containing protein n=1 Tax=Armillaria luteobubalina TaxID=153913 RepID=A0AA39P181_9AGAR|nr:hypothetical protein EDD18DRAFT_1470227 [Armillaria luteobubalina]